MCLLTDENGNLLSEEEIDEFMKEIEEKLSAENERISCDYGRYYII